MKLVNKSFTIRNLERKKNQEKASKHNTDSVSIETDMFQINKASNNEIGKDVELIETLLQDSLKAIYLTVL